MVVAKNLGRVDTHMVDMHYGELAPSYANMLRALAVQSEGEGYSGLATEGVRIPLSLHHKSLFFNLLANFLHRHPRSHIRGANLSRRLSLSIISGTCAFGLASAYG